ncbi:hypothetical protein B1K54_34875 [Streptomyces sp. fd1-xmd]|nr:hypothetical protein B1K54_34875 [Streptomyces sp. fd1-xmd]
MEFCAQAHRADLAAAALTAPAVRATADAAAIACGGGTSTGRVAVNGCISAERGSGCTRRPTVPPGADGLPPRQGGAERGRGPAPEDGGRQPRHMGHRVGPPPGRWISPETRKPSPS